MDTTQHDDFVIRVLYAMLIQVSQADVWYHIVTFHCIYIPDGQSYFCAMLLSGLVDNKFNLSSLSQSISV